MLKTIILFLFTILSLQASTEVSLALPWKNQFQFAGYYMAKEKGFYKKHGLSLNIKEFDLQRNNADDVASGKYDFGVGHSDIILDILNKHYNLKLLAAIYQSSPLVLLCKKRDDIQTLKDIQNKTVMMNSDNAVNSSILAMLSSKVIKKGSYKVVKTSSFTLKSFIDGSVDLRTAYLSNEPFTLINKNIPYTIFNPKDYGYNFYSDILFTSQNFIDKHPKVVKAFYEASLEGWKYAFAHINESVDTILNHYNTQNKTKEALLYEAKILKKFAFKQGIALGNIDPLRLEELVNSYRLLGLTENNSKIKYRDLIFKDSLMKNNQEKTLNILTIFYSNHHSSIYIFIAIFLFIIFITISILYIMKRLLKKQKKEIAKYYEIFDKNVASSRTDLSGKIIHVTEALCIATGYTREELIGQNHRIFKDPNDTTTTDYKDLWLTITSGHTWKGEFHNLNKDGSSYWASSIISPIFAHDKIIAYKAIGEDITIKKVLQEFNQKLEIEVKKQTHELQEKEIYLNTLFDINPNISYVLKNGILERANKAFLDFTESDSLEEFLETHKCICELFEENSEDNRHKNLHYINDKSINSHCSTDAKVTIKAHTFELSTHSFIIDKEERQLVILKDITIFEKTATTDKLTGLYNRVRLDSELAKNEQYYQEFNENFSLILIDIDFFKKVNDTYGHLIGDEVLKDMALITKNNIRSTDILARWGGEEFMIICPNTDKQSAFAIAQNIRKSIETQKLARNLEITISAGVSDMLSSNTLNDLVESTDKALYLAKESGRNRVEM